MLFLLSQFFNKKKKILTFVVFLRREPLTDCLKDVDLIPPFNRMLLEVTFGKLYAWAIQNVRNILLDANAKFKELGESHFVAVGSGENCFE